MTVEGHDGADPTVPDRDGQRRQIMLLVKAYVRSSDTATDRAILLSDLVLGVYDATKFAFADGGLVDSDERAGMAQVVDAARNHHDAALQQEIARRHPTPKQQLAAAQLQAQFDADRLDPSEAFQRTVTNPRPGDEEPIGLTRRQASKVANIVDRLLGHEGPASDVDRLAALLAGDYLQALAGRGQGMAAPSVEAAAAQFHALPEVSRTPPSAAADNEPSSMTRLQALRCAAVVQAFADGAEMWRHAAEEACLVLRLVANGRPGMDAAWDRLSQNYPWPPPNRRTGTEGPVA